MRASYRTVLRPATAEIEVKRSRFRCRLERVESESAARAVVDAERRTHWDARHHCSAFVLGADGGVQRSNDDGEPAGTAGAPMLDVLVRRDVSDVVAVVTRWFGGTLLGAGGLVRAYSDAVGAALDEAGLLTRTRARALAVRIGHGEAGRVENEVRAAGLHVRNVAYADRVTLDLVVAEADVQDVTDRLLGWTAGQAEVVAGEPAWLDGTRRTGR